MSSQAKNELTPRFRVCTEDTIEIRTGKKTSIFVKPIFIIRHEITFFENTSHRDDCVRFFRFFHLVEFWLDWNNVIHFWIQSKLTCVINYGPNNQWFFSPPFSFLCVRVSFGPKEPGIFYRFHNIFIFFFKTHLTIKRIENGHRYAYRTARYTLYDRDVYITPWHLFAFSDTRPSITPLYGRSRQTFHMCMHIISITIQYNALVCIINYSSYSYCTRVSSSCIRNRRKMHWRLNFFFYLKDSSCSARISYR